MNTKLNKTIYDNLTKSGECIMNSELANRISKAIEEEFELRDKDKTLNLILSTRVLEIKQSELDQIEYWFKSGKIGGKIEILK